MIKILIIIISVIFFIIIIRILVKKNTSLTIYHDAGFFSCCTVKLKKIVEFYNTKKRLPSSVNSRAQFKDYKKISQKNEDITYKFFQIDNNVIIPYNSPIKLTNALTDDQFSDYKLLNFEHIRLFIDKYFSFSEEVENCIANLISKYNINIDNTYAVRYRGNDKSLETVQPSYDDMIEKTKEVLEKYDNNNMKQLILQTDEREFSEKFRAVFPNTIVFTEIPDMLKQTKSIQHTEPREDRLLSTQYFIASLFIISRCEHVIHTSGNGEMWMAFFRNNSRGLHQYLRPRENIYGNINNSFDSKQTYFWIDN
jgi:hypothetical protein